MPVKTKRDEEKWQKAKERAAEEGQEGNWAYIMGIYKKMKPDYQFKTAATRVAARWLARLVIAKIKRKRRSRGGTKAKRRRNYQRKKHQRKEQNRRWRVKNPSKTKRTRRRYKRNPMVRRVIKAYLEAISAQNF